MYGFLAPAPVQSLRGFRRIFSKFKKLKGMFVAFVRFALIVEGLLTGPSYNLCDDVRREFPILLLIAFQSDQRRA